MKYIGLFLLLGLFGAGTFSLHTDRDGPKYQPPNILFLIADDWSYPHAGIYGDKVVRTPTFDWLAKNGALFENAYCAAPSCSPSRASILLGRYPHQNESAGNLWSVIPDKFPNWVTLLKHNGYHTGKSRKGWGPGDFVAGGYEQNPAGQDYADFKDFLSNKKAGQPFSFWFGSNDPHRNYETNTGVKAGMDRSVVEVPAFLPDLPCVRNDIMDYYFEVERFDRECGHIIKTLEEEGLLDNTLIVMTSDNGMPFPRAKATLYDFGTRMPLAIYWKGHIEGGRRIADFMNFVDFAPTFLEAAGMEVSESFSGNSLLDIFRTDGSQVERNKVFLERERHANVRKGDLSYPSRAIRTKDYLYIRNFEPGRWPAGDPETHISVGQYGDVDNSITKFLLMKMEPAQGDTDYFQLAFGKRPAEEFFVLEGDPYSINNRIQDPAYAEEVRLLQIELQKWMEQTDDLRASQPRTTYWDTVRYTPDYDFSDFDLDKKIKAYTMLSRDRGTYREAICE